MKPPGGVRTFPILALAGGLLYALAPATGLLFLGGLTILGLWLAVYYWQRLELQRTNPRTEPAPGVRLDGGILAPVGNLIAFLLGPVTLTQPLWVPVTVAVATVLFTGAREKLHALAGRLGGGELVTLGKFLIVIGIVLPLVPDEPVTSLTAITPYQVWLAVVVVSSLSYASYLLQRYVAPRHGLLYSAALGGLYSSTATTVVLSRQARAKPAAAHKLHAALVLSTTVMFLRILAVVAIFNIALATTLLPSIAALFLFGLVVTGLLLWRDAGGTAAEDTLPPSNPLEIQTALIFAFLFIALSLGVGWARANFGEESLFALAALAGVTDVDPLVLSIAQGGQQGAALHMDAAAILIAAASNNVLKGVYTLVFAGRLAGLVPAAALLLLAAGGGIAAIVMLGLS